MYSGALSACEGAWQLRLKQLRTQMQMRCNSESAKF